MINCVDTSYKIRLLFERLPMN